MTEKKSIFDTFARNLKNEAEGVWVAFDGDVEIRLVSLQSEEAETLIEKLKKPYARQGRETKIPNKALTAIFAKVLSTVVIKDWKNVVGKDGVEIPFSPKAAYDLLVLPELSKLLDDIVQAARTRETFLEDEAFLEDTEKNSEKSSAGN
jgi:hypothetical protein